MKGIFKPLARIMLLVMLLTSAVIAETGLSFAADDNDEKFGTAEIWSTFGGEPLTDSFYYSDSWFDSEPERQNDKLALVSMQLVASATDDDEDSRGAAFLEKLGFEDIGFQGYHTGADVEDCAYMYGTKKAGNNTIIAIVIQSYSLDDIIKLKGWKQNFTVNGESPKGEHAKLSEASESVLEGIADKAAGGEGKIKYWIMGHSRGGALANLISAKLPAELEANGTPGEIFAYTFEAPATADAKLIEDQSKYSYIHNYSCSDDIVTMVPPAGWEESGMTLYGAKHALKTEETDAHLNEELEKLGSKAKYEEESELGNNTAENIMAKLISRIRTRASYSEQRTEYFTMPNGEKVTINYSYQQILVRLMEVLFGDNKISTEGLADRLSEAAPMLDSYIRAYLTELHYLTGDESDANVYYLDAARKLCEFLDPKGEGNLPFVDREAYVLLKLAAPVLINPDVADDFPDYAVTDEPIIMDEAMLYIEPGVTIAGNAGELTFSHHFDTCIARLKTLAPLPPVQDIALTIDPPQVGDKVSKVTRDTEASVDGLGLDWLDASSKWDTDDPTLKRNMTYYLNTTFYIKGHSIPEGVKFTVNGESPCTDPKVSYRDGITVVRCTYKYTFGTPEEYQVTFDTERGETPEPFTVTKGTKLKYLEEPAMADMDGWRFGGWHTDDWQKWDEVEFLGANTEFDEFTFYADWIKLINKVEVTFTVPAVGQTWAMPRVPKNAPYHLENAVVRDSSYNIVSKITKKQRLTLEFDVVPNSRYYALAADSYDEDDSGEYIGSLTVKGAKMDNSYLDYAGSLCVSCYFTPLDNAKTALQKGGSFKKADKVIRSKKTYKSLPGSAKKPLKLRIAKKAKKSIRIKWNKAKGAKKYVVYGALKGQKFRKIATTKKRTYTVKKIGGKKIVRRKRYKFIVVAVSGSKVISTSRTVVK